MISVAYPVTTRADLVTTPPKPGYRRWYQHPYHQDFSSGCVHENLRYPDLFGAREN